jgi:hypothetical protein
MEDISRRWKEEGNERLANNSATPEIKFRGGFMEDGSRGKVGMGGRGEGGGVAHNDGHLQEREILKSKQGNCLFESSQLEHYNSNHTNFLTFRF